MSVSVTQRKPAAERIAVRCVDSDVHPAPRRGELIQYIPEPWRSKYFLARNVGEQIYYDAPDYAHTFAMRVDALMSFANATARRIGAVSPPKPSASSPDCRVAMPFQHPTSFATSVIGNS